MPTEHTVTGALPAEPANVSDLLRATATSHPDHLAAIECRRDGSQRDSCTFADLEHLVQRLAAGLAAEEIGPGDRIVLMVRPGIRFLALTFALFRSGATVVLIDPGMGLRNVLACLEQATPHGFVAIASVQWARWACRRRFPRARKNIRVGGWFPSRASYRTLAGNDLRLPKPVNTTATDPAAIIFTSGSTGPAKGVVYEHGMFCAQARLLQQQFQIQPGERDLPAFPLFALFNVAMGVTTVIPDIDTTKPASVDPRHVVAPIRVQHVTQAFASPAVWDRVGRYCRDKSILLPTLHRVLSAGAPVPPAVVDTLRRSLTAEDADIYTPYGATEALPVAVISGSQILDDTAASSADGAGTCVGTLFPEINLQIIRITEEPLSVLTPQDLAAPGEVGEIVVSGPPVTRTYFQRPEATRAAKFQSDGITWHRMGDLGYVDEQQRLWFCGRKAHRVECDHELLLSVCCEAIFNQHPAVRKSALVGVGPRPRQLPVIVIECEPGTSPTAGLEVELLDIAASHPKTELIHDVLFHDALPVDIRHNVKINREALAEWASTRIAVDTSDPPTRPPSTKATE